MSIDEKSSYYDAGGIETLAIIEAKLTPEQYAGFLLGNILKYSTRANFKGQSERDVEKVAVYSQQLKALQAKHRALADGGQTKPKRQSVSLHAVGDTTVAHGKITDSKANSSNGKQPIPKNVSSIKKSSEVQTPTGDLIA